MRREIRIGLSLYSLSFVRTGSAFLDVMSGVAVAKHCGFHYIEIPYICGLSVLEVCRISNYSKQSGVCIYSVHLPKDLIDNISRYNISEIKQFLSIIQPKIVVMHPAMNLNCTKVIDIAKNIVTLDMELSIENIFSRQILKKLGFCDKRIGITVDFHHTYRNGDTIEEMIQTFSNQINHFHIRDYSSTSYKDYIPPGSGDLIITDILACIMQSAVYGCYILECPMKSINEVSETKALLDEMISVATLIS